VWEWQPERKYQSTEVVEEEEEENTHYSQKKEEVEEKTLYSQAEMNEPMLQGSRRPSSPPTKLGPRQESRESKTYAGRGAIASYAREEAGETGQAFPGGMESHTVRQGTLVGRRTPQPYASALATAGATRVEHVIVPLPVNSRTAPHTFKGEPYERKVLYSSLEGRTEQKRGPSRGEQNSGVAGRVEADRVEMKEETVVAYTDQEFLDKVRFDYPNES
jgi:hypothetical protein